MRRPEITEVFLGFAPPSAVEQLEMGFAGAPCAGRTVAVLWHTPFDVGYENYVPPWLRSRGGYALGYAPQSVYWAADSGTIEILSVSAHTLRGRYQLSMRFVASLHDTTRRSLVLRGTFIVPRDTMLERRMTEPNAPRATRCD